MTWITEPNWRAKVSGLSQNLIRKAGKEEAGKIFSFFPIFLIHILECLHDPMSQPKRSAADQHKGTRITFS